MKNLKHFILLILLFINLINDINGQVGIGTSNPNANASLELFTSSQGMLFPRLTSIQRDAITNPAKGLTIFNTTLNTIQTNIGNSATPNWKSFRGDPSSNGTAVVSTYSFATTPTGNLVVGTEATGVTQTITANVTTIGTYSISSSANGLTFTATGTFTNIGLQNIILTATGTPTAVGSNTFSLNTTPNFSFSRTTVSPTSNGTAVINTFNCSTDSSGYLMIRAAVTGVTQTITAIVNNVGTYNISAIANGLTYFGTGTFVGVGSQSIVLTATGAPITSGKQTFTLNTAPNCSFIRTTADTVTAANGRVWMDRNLGATQVATSSTDALSYGHLFQWGRAADGHQKRTSSTTTTLSSSNTPGHANFILGLEWQSSMPSNLWQGVNGINNPCPSGYRIPSTTELNVEKNSWSSQNAAGAINSPLKLPMAGSRSNSNGIISSGTEGNYISNAYLIDEVYFLQFNSGNLITNSTTAACTGLTVRCIKN